jgi:hypothetical protein
MPPTHDHARVPCARCGAPLGEHLDACGDVPSDHPMIKAGFHAVGCPVIPGGDSRRLYATPTTSCSCGAMQTDGFRLRETGTDWHRFDGGLCGRGKME